MDAIKRKQFLLKFAEELRTCADAIEKDAADMPPHAYTDGELTNAIAHITLGVNARVTKLVQSCELPEDRFLLRMLEIRL